MTLHHLPGFYPAVYQSHQVGKRDFTVPSRPLGASLGPATLQLQSRNPRSSEYLRVKPSEGNSTRLNPATVFYQDPAPLNRSWCYESGPLRVWPQKRSQSFTIHRETSRCRQNLPHGCPSSSPVPQLQHHHLLSSNAIAGRASDSLCPLSAKATPRSAGPKRCPARHCQRYRHLQGISPAAGVGVGRRKRTALADHRRAIATGSGWPRADRQLSAHAPRASTARPVGPSGDSRFKAQASGSLI